MANGQHHGEAGDLRRQPRGHPLIAVEPGHRFDGRATAWTLQPRARKHDPGVPVEDRQIADAALGDIVDRHHLGAAAAAPLGVSRNRAQSQHELRNWLRRTDRILLDVNQLKPLPPAEQLASERAERFRCGRNP